MSIGGQPAGTRPGEFGRYCDVGAIAAVLRVLLLGQALTNLVVAGYCALKISNLGQVDSLGLVSSPDLPSTERALRTVTLIDTTLFAVCALAFVVWTYLAYRNLRTLGTSDQRFATGWGAGCWFVPVLMWWRPRQVIADIWRASDTAAPVLLAWWWAFWLFSLLSDRVAAWYGTGTIAEAKTGTWLLLASRVTSAVAAILAARVVGKLTRRQRDRAARLAYLPLAAPGRTGLGPERPV